MYSYKVNRVDVDEVRFLNTDIWARQELIGGIFISKQVVLAWNSDTLIKHVQIVIGNTYNVEDIMSIPTSISKATKPAVVETAELELV